MSRTLLVAIAAGLSIIGCQDTQVGSSTDDSEPSEQPTPHAFQQATSGLSGVVGEPMDDAAPLFDQEKVLTYELIVSPIDLARINAMPAAEQYVPATLRVLGETVAVSLRYKGDVGSFMSPCTLQTIPNVTGAPSLLPKTGKCSFKIAFDEQDEEARFHGLKKLNLHAMGHDASLMKERLGYGLYRAMGVAAPRATHARVVINGRLEGVFLAVEEIDGRFARSRFSEGGKGNLYKEVWPAEENEKDVRNSLEANKGDTTSVAKMMAFQKAIEKDPAQAAATWLDRQYMLAYLAVDRAILNDDGFLHWYCYTNHNFFWYEATANNRMWLIPWDLDDSLSPDSATSLITKWDTPAPNNCDVCGLGLLTLDDRAAHRTPSCDPLIAELTRWKADFSTTINALIRGPFSAANVDAKLERWSKQIEPLVVEAEGIFSAKGRTEWKKGVAEVRETIRMVRATYAR